MRKCLLRRVFAVRLLRLLLPGSLAAMMLLQPVLADEPERSADIDQCRAIAADKERLRCYDTIADGGVFDKRQVQPEQNEKRKNQADRSAEQVSVTIVRVQQGQDRRHYFHTAEGAVWKQTGRGSWSRAVPFEARIKKGALSSYFLVTEGGKSTRIKRVR